MLKVKNYEKVSNYLKYFTFEDSSSYCLYDNIVNPQHILRIWKYDNSIEFINGDFKKGLKVISILRSANLISDNEFEQLSLF